MGEYQIGGKQLTVHPLTVLARQQAFKDALVADAFEQIEATDPSRGRTLAGAKRVEDAKAWLLKQVALHEYDYRGPMQVEAFQRMYGATIAVAVSLADKVDDWPALLPLVREWRKDNPDEWDRAYQEVGVASGFFTAPVPAESTADPAKA